MPLEDKVALITGSSRGIGSAIALELAQRGVHIAVNYFRHREAAQDTADAVRALGVRAEIFKAHLGDPKKIATMFAEIDRVFGGVDILVGNAASGVLRPILEIDQRAWEWTVGVNSQSILWCAQHAAPVMAQRGWGRIITVTSIGSTRVLPEYSIVGVSKAAIEALTRYLAVELAPKGIAVNAVSPGAVDTEALLAFPSRDAILERARSVTPAGRIVTPTDVAKVVAWLCTDDAAMIVGQTITVDGGYSVLA